MKQAIILAAGEGQRLRPFTVNRPKAMLSIADKPILQYVVEVLAEQGIRNIVMVVGYRKDQVFDHMGSGEQFGVEISYVTQKEQLGTAHALVQARDAAEDRFLVLPGDKLIEGETIAQLMEAKPQTMLVKAVNDPARYGVVAVARGKVKSVVEKPRQAETNIVNTGIYLFSKDIFEALEEEINITDALNCMIEQGKTIHALETEATWLDVVYPWDLLALNDAVLGRIQPGLNGQLEPGVTLRGRVSIGKGTVLRSNTYVVGPVVIGEGCDIGPNVCILPSTSISDNVVISAFTEVKGSVIGDDVHIGPGSTVHDSVIDKGCVIRARFTACSGQNEVVVNEEHHTVNVGAMVGEGCKIDDCVVAQPGVIVGNYCQVQPMKLISGRLPDKSLVY